MKTVIVIPARMGSSRFPGKPLAQIAGMSLIERVWHIAKAVEGVDDVIVATDHEKIQKHVGSFGGQAVMTPETCRNGSERVWEAVKHFSRAERPDIIINLQGDAVTTPPWIIRPIVEAMETDASIQICTPAVRLNEQVYGRLKAAKAAGEVGGTTVVFNKNHDALYFSKGIIPYVRTKVGQALPIFKHVGLYGYRYETLQDYLALPPGVLEQTEELEQLRALEHGIPIRVVEVDTRGHTLWAVDSPEDARRAEAIIQTEGELIS